MRIGFFGLAILAVVGCVRPQPARPLPEGVVAYRGRSIDLTPYLEGFPWTWRVVPEYGGSQWLYFHDRPGGRDLLAQPMASGNERLVPEAGRLLAPGVDWGARNYWAMRWHARSQAMIVWGDDHADEANQLFWVPLDGGAMRTLTHVPYVAGFGVDAENGQVAWLSRDRATAPFTSCLHLMSAAFEDREVLCDSPEETFAVGEVFFAPDGSLILRTRAKADRNRTTLARVDPAAPRLELLLPDVARGTVEPLTPWLSDQRFLFLSDEGGTTALWRYDLPTRSAAKLFGPEGGVGSAAVLDSAAVVTVARADGVDGASPASDELMEVVALDRESGAVLSTVELPDNAEILAGSGDRMAVVRDSRNAPPQVEEWIWGQGKWTVVPRLAPTAEDAQRFTACQSTRVEIPAEGGRVISAWLQSPRHSASAADRFALVEGYYGGEDIFDANAQVVCAAGGVALSPAIHTRQEDLGGDEVADLFRCGRWLQEKTRLDHSRIGIWGGSHGGYETLRALTFPDAGRYPFGFGMSHGGISDLLSFFTESRIPDWMRREAGDPVKDRERLASRSPLAHVDLLAAPVLLTNGALDTRVSPSQSGRFFDRAKGLGKDVTWMQLAGQGHHVEGIAAAQELWAARFDFLDHAVGSTP